MFTNDGLKRLHSWHRTTKHCPIKGRATSGRSTDVDTKLCAGRVLYSFNMQVYKITKFQVTLTERKESTKNGRSVTIGFGSNLILTVIAARRKPVYVLTDFIF